MTDEKIIKIAKHIQNMKKEPQSSLFTCLARILTAKLENAGVTQDDLNRLGFYSIN